MQKEKQSSRFIFEALVSDNEKLVVKPIHDKNQKSSSVHLRKIGIDVLHDVPWGIHFCQFYETKEDLIEILVPYFKAGLENNEFCMWITSEPLHVDDARKALAIKVKNLDEYLKKGQIEILDSTEWYTKSGKFDANTVISNWVKKEAWSRKNGFDGLRLSGNTFWVQKKDWPDFTDYEEIINNMIHNYHMIAICSYSLSKCNASEIIDAVSNHQFVLIKRKRRWHRIESPEIKKVEQVLDESRSLFETVFSSMHEAVVIINTVGDFINFNEAFTHFCKYNKKDECPRSLSEFAKIIKVYTLDGKVISLEKWASVRGFKAGMNLNNEFVFERVDTGETWIANTSFVQLRNNRKEIIGVVQTMYDITEREKTLAALREAQTKYRTVADNTYDFEFWIDPKGNYIYASPSCKRVTGYCSEDFLSNSSLRHEIIHPDDKQIFLHHLCNDVSKKKPGELEFRIVHKDGSVKWIHHVCQPITDGDGRFLGTRGSNRDITERRLTEEAFKESELRYRRLFEASKDGVLLLDFNTGKILDVNPFLIKLLGFSKDDFTQKHLWDIGAFKDIISSKDKFGELQNKEYIHYENLPLETKDGKKIDVEFVSNVYKVNGKKTIQCNIRDISERKKMEETLQKKTEELEKFFNVALDLLCIADIDGNFIKLNKTWENILGYKVEELEKKKFLDFVHPDDIKATTNAVSVLAAQKPILNFTNRYRCKDGTYRYIEWRSFPQGKLIYAAARDITDHMQTEIELTRLASFPENSPNPIIEVDLSGYIHYSNPSAREKFPGLENAGYTHPFFKDIRNLFIDFQKGRLSPTKTREIRVDNKYYLQTLFFMPENSRIRIYSIEITERKQAEETLRENEEKYRRIVENTTNVIMVTQPNGIISYLSPSCQQVFGYPLEELVGKNPTIFFKEDAEKVQRAFSHALQGEKGSNLEYRIVTKNGDIKWISHSWSPVIIANKFQSVISVIEDITLRKSTEENMQRLHKALVRHSVELAAANRELEAFSYSVSHDLRAPLRSIDGFSQALLEDYENKIDETGKDYIQRVRKATQKMGQLIDDLLRLSRLSRAELHYEKTDISSLAQNIMKKLKNTNHSRNVEIKIQEGLIADCDKKLLEILLDNLLENAWKFTGNTKHTIIEIGETTKNNETVYFIRDNGAGFDMAYADKLFIPFQRLHSSDEFAGTGIGLAIATRIINRHGGKIWAEGKVGKGATFYFTLKH